MVTVVPEVIFDPAAYFEEVIIEVPPPILEAPIPAKEAFVPVSVPPRVVVVAPRVVPPTVLPPKVVVPLKVVPRLVFVSVKTLEVFKSEICLEVLRTFPVAIFPLGLIILPEEVVLIPPTVRIGLVNPVGETVVVFVVIPVFPAIIEFPRVGVPMNCLLVDLERFVVTGGSWETGVPAVGTAVAG